LSLDAKILKNCFAKRIQQTIRVILNHDLICCILGFPGCFSI
jgi:hypothetical protein